MIAKRFIPAIFRIMVDAVRHHDHPAFMDLIGDTLEEKIQYGRGGDGSVCLRISRVNHDCNQYDPIHDVRVFFSQRAIQSGEEITMTYFPLLFSDHQLTPTETKKCLKDMYGIVCKSDCICRDLEFEKLVNETM